MNEAIAALWPDPVTGLMWLFILAVAGIGLFGGIRMIRRGARSRRRWRQMQHESVSGLAIVVATRDETHLVDDKGRQWQTSVPILQFHTAAGAVVTAEGPALSGPGFAVGTTVPIRYLPQDPQQVELMLPDAQSDTGNGMFLGGIYVVVIAAALLVGVPIVILVASQP
ncbi:MAG: hypothetical protein IRY85_09175 [Micromonosporaceae bacterium]|nr:hypothetical protein [Micromonosporaceae bacterium]